MKPLGIKNYGSIPHLPGSNTGIADHTCQPGQAKLVLEKPKRKNQIVICEEKLDGSNVGICKKNGVIHPLTRSGYIASSSPYEQHHYFAQWVYANTEKFDWLSEGYRVVGEWLLQAHETVYDLPLTDPFVGFDILDDQNRRFCVEYRDELFISYEINKPYLIHKSNEGISIEDAYKRVCEKNYYNAQEALEGCVWRLETTNPYICEFIAKWVYPGKTNGCHIPGLGIGKNLFGIVLSDVTLTQSFSTYIN